MTKAMDCLALSDTEESSSVPHPFGAVHGGPWDESDPMASSTRRASLSALTQKYAVGPVPLKERVASTPSITKPMQQCRSRAKRHWTVATNVIRSFNAMRELNVEEVLDMDKLIADLGGYDRSFPRPAEDSERSFLTQALEEYRRRERLFEMAARGSKQDLRLLEHELDRDPKRFLLEEGHPDAMVNSRNHADQTPLYLAAKNGNADIVRFLLDRHADPHYICKLGVKEQETALECAARWGHVRVVSTLLERAIWSKQEITAAYKAASSPLIKRLLKRPASSSSCICS
eukprot:GILK01005500.1.p1 GENE.GILK01005500.1~~GILK01005500.1.p1  ORF type:complete len:288 (+),score=39.45 GILK01005500.1:108-971(+)